MYVRLDISLRKAQRLAAGPYATARAAGAADAGPVPETRSYSLALARFGRAGSGAIAPLAAVVISTFVLAAGAALDISRLVTARTQLRDAVDSADLAIARLPASTSDADVKAKAQAWISANLSDPDIQHLVVGTPVRSAGQIQLSATADIATTLASLFGIARLPVQGGSTVRYGTTHVELALVLDNTGSMNDDSKLDSLKAAATTLVKSLNDSASQSGDADALKVGVVPFSMTVNVGSAYQTASWISGSVPAEYGANGDAVDPGHPDRFKLLSAMGVPWGGCIESRPQPYDVQDTAPTTANKATLFVPFFAPDEPDQGYYNVAYNGATYRLFDYGSFALGKATAWAASTYNTRYFSENNYEPDKVVDGFLLPNVGGSWADHQNNGASKYDRTPIFDVSAIWGDAIGPNAGCTVRPIQRLTTDVASIYAQINGMVAGGDTEIPLGLVWGWHVLSPNPPFADGAAYGASNTVKVAVLVTDGANTYGASSNPNGSHYTAYGYAAQRRIGDGTAAGVASALNDRLQTLCENMKAKNADSTWRINIYAVPLEVTDANIKTLLRGCVTDPSNYLEVASSNQLSGVFANIAGSIGALRVAH